MTVTSTIDVVIPVHSTSRPIRRAVVSALASKHPGISVIVMCHNVSATAIRAELAGVVDSRMHLIEHTDNIQSPAGPRNAWIHRSHADYLTFLDSDDEYDPGTLDFWISELRGQDVHIGQLIYDSRGRVLAPAPRIGRFKNLDPVKDLLYYRTAPVAALIRRELLADPHAPTYTEGMRSGEDVMIGIYLWSIARRIDYSRFSGGYRVRESAVDRVTGEPIPFVTFTQPIEALLESSWFQTLDQGAREAATTKLLRSQILAPLRLRAASNNLRIQELKHAQRVTEHFIALSPGSIATLTRRDAAPIKLLLHNDLSSALAQLSMRSRTLTLKRFLPERFSSICSPESLLRRALREYLVPLTLTSRTPRALEGVTT